MNKTYTLLYRLLSRLFLSSIILCNHNFLCSNNTKVKNTKVKKFLFDAILGGDLEKVKSVKDSLENIVFDNCSYSERYMALTGKDLYIPGYKPIHLAALAGKLDIVKYLIEERKIDLNSENTDSKENAIFIAASAGHIDIVDYFLSKGGDVNAKSNNNNKETLLQIAGKKGFPALVIFLLSKKAKLNKKYLDKVFSKYFLESSCFYWKKTVEEKVDFVVANLEKNILSRQDFINLFDMFMFKSIYCKIKKGKLLDKDFYSGFCLNLYSKIRANKKLNDIFCEYLNINNNFVKNGYINVVSMIVENSEISTEIKLDLVKSVVCEFCKLDLKQNISSFIYKNDYSCSKNLRLEDLIVRCL